MSRPLALTPTALRVAIRLAAQATGWKYRDIATEMGMPQSALHKAVQRAQVCGLIDQSRRVRRAALDELCRHGAKYAFAGHPVLDDVRAYLGEAQ